ncbi:MAG: GspH/FimT family pseudopilin [Neisseriaceae bacterium]|nr:GspH/FimT family pseudopilin [Neisseriaceae bacterium]MBP6863285.1 GspH/FimT family pseudopilin [Neisseriaceae bacterium]
MARINTQGFGLWELLLALGLLALMSGGLLLALQRSVAQQQLGLQMRFLGQTLQFAQLEAGRLGRPLWLCPVQLRVDGRINGCVRQLSEDMWAQGLLVYADQPGLNMGSYDSGEVVRTVFVDERRHRLQLRQWREQGPSSALTLTSLPQRQPQIRYGVRGWGDAEPVWLQLQLSPQGRAAGECALLLLPPSGPPQYCQDLSNHSERARLCVCF